MQLEGQALLDSDFSSGEECDAECRNVHESDAADASE